MFIIDFKNQAVRDLAWAISTPPLLTSTLHHCSWPTSGWYQGLYQETLPWFKKLDQDCSSLDALISEQKDRRLGKYFETLWFYWLSHHPRYEIVEHNLQIIIDGETLGEIDFILFDKKTRKMLHWEVAVKFYLGVDDPRQMNNWHGPNLIDRLDIKFNHLLNKQSMISQDKRVAEWLQKKDLVIDQCAVILKGRLYYQWAQLEKLQLEMLQLKLLPPKLLKPENTKDTTTEDIIKLYSPEQSCADHLHSKWLRKSEFDERFDNRSDQQTRFLPLINNGWMEGLPTAGIIETYSRAEIYKALSNKKLRLPLHLRLYQRGKAAERLFLVGESWPKIL